MIALRVAVIPIVLLLASCGGGSSNQDSDAPQDAVSSEDGASGEEGGSDGIPDGTGSSPGVTDDVTAPESDSPLQVQVTFDITVPAYSSDQLSVDVAWGDLTLAASWVGDQVWTATGDLPAETEQPLVVNFTDRNGAITLASFETRYRTGVNSSESFAISVDDFDTARWDDDADGVSNIDELTAGTDPLIDESGDAGGLRTLYFTITVPPYVSDELQVRLTVPRISEDDYVFDAQWQGDELWTAQRSGFTNSRVFTVIVEFLDRNGDLKLGSNEERFSTFINDPTEIVIDDEFDTRSWDEDGDGRSNYDEVRAGTDPLVADAGAVPVTVIESFDFPGIDRDLAWLSHVEGRFKALDLPASFSEQIVNEGNGVREVEDVTYDFSAGGDGTYSSELVVYTEGDAPSTIRREGTRSADGNEVMWTGTSTVTTEFRRVQQNYRITSSIEDRNIIQSARLDKTTTAVSNGDVVSDNGYEYEVVLDADSIDADQQCEITSGSISQSSSTNSGIRTASRPNADERWRVSGIDPASADGASLPELTEAETLVTRFYCDHRFAND